ncbi:hypothetical protein QYF36_014644 [Acer negundo]|nr:hypothetical protein QYF36_014644 [Acer negundo]
MGCKNLNIDTILGKPFEDVKSHYTLGKELGRGQFGVTHLCTENSTGKKFSCKSISKRKLVTKNDKDDINREIQIMQHMSGAAKHHLFILAIGKGILLGEDLILDITHAVPLPNGVPGHFLLIGELELGNLVKIYLLQDLTF